jgi:LytS/YehU family sensor histidine kinase
LLNTLNNIYALTAFDTEKAQQAIQELSKLLRYVLYDNQETFVPLTKEVEFIQNYIELMRIRVSSAVKINTNFQIRPDSQSPVAPLLFISLIENAFKHGISPTEPSFIDITLTEKDDEIHCVIRNSNYPKNAMDKSGSGIGLEQVRKRLELLYAGRYEWHQQISSNQKEYSSILTIKIPDNNKKILP